MNRKKLSKKTLALRLILLAVIVCSASLTVVALSKKTSSDINSNESLMHYDSIQLVNELKKKNLNRLIDDVNKLNFFEDEEKLICYYDVIRSKLHDATKKDITKELLDNNNTDDVKINILTLCDSENIALDFEELIPILDDDKVSASVKTVLIDLMANEGDEFVDRIEAEVLAFDELTIMRALASLQYLIPEKAEAIANDILSDLTKDFSATYKAGLVTKATALYLNSSEQEKNNFIDICDKILNEMNAEDEDEKSISVIYALSSIQSKETFSYLMSIENELAESFRAYIVEENQEVINDIFNESPSNESTELLAKTSAYYVPQAEYHKNIKMYIEKNASYFDLNQAQRNILLDVIK